MINRNKVKQILWFETFSFLLLILLSWLDELVSLPQLVFGGGDHTNWQEAMLETSALVIVWLIVIIFTKRLMRRLFYLDGFLRICAWCRKIGYEDDWITTEDYFSRGFATETSHGICPVCQAQLAKEGKKHAA